MMSENSQEPRVENEEFAFIHDTEKGQVLIFKEPEKVTIMFHIENVAVAQMTIDVGESSHEVFGNLKNFETVRAVVNKSLNQEYL